MIHIFLRKEPFRKSMKIYAESSSVSCTLKYLTLKTNLKSKRDINI